MVGICQSAADLVVSDERGFALMLGSTVTAGGGGTTAAAPSAPAVDRASLDANAVTRAGADAALIATCPGIR